MPRFEEFERELNVWVGRRVVRILNDLKSAQRDIQAAILDVVGTAETFTVDRLQLLDQQINIIRSDLKRRVSSVGSSAEPLAQMVQRQHEAAIKQITGRSLSVAFNQLDVQTLALFSLNELDKVTSVVVPDKLQQIRSALFSRVGVQGLNPAQVARQIAGTPQFEGAFARVENILRTESSTVYNARSVQSLQQANEQYDLGLNKQIIETIDASRNHPISQVLNLQVRQVSDPFQARVSAVDAVAKKIKRSGGGVFWQVVNGVYTGQRLPAHYRERGVVVPTDDPVTPFA